MSTEIDVRRHCDALDKNYVLLLTSNSVERACVDRVLQSARTADVGRDTKGCGIGFVGRRFAVHVTGESGISKPLSVARIAGSLLADSNFPKPALVLLVGFCWGNPNRADVGKVLVSPHLVSLNEVLETPDGPRKMRKTVSSPLELSEGVVRILEEGEVLIGPIGSLETRYQSTDSRNLLISQNPDLLGAEMEAFGLFPVEFPWLVVKTISDLGDDAFTREKQNDAAQRAAATVPRLIEILDDAGSLPEYVSDTAQVVLEDLLTGNSLSIGADEVAANGLNDLLNDVIGGPLLRKLGRYVSPLEYDVEFPSLMCALVLEVMQNAIKHGGANRATVTLHPTKILIEDDGEAFNPTTLSGANGGARDWRGVKEHYLDDGKVEFSARTGAGGKGNRYVFALPKATTALREARRNCSMRIASRSVGAEYGRPPVLDFDENCSILYFNTAGILMTSRRISVAASMRKVLEGGRKVYVGCATERDVVFFKEELKDLLGENLVVFVDVPR